MDFRWLQDFLSLVEANSFTSAANSRHSSQSAFSRRIRSLETWLGAELIDRSRYPTALTPAGETFRVHAAEFIKRMIDSRAELLGNRIDSEVITFALPHTLAISKFPRWWREWSEGADGLSCKLLAGNLHDAIMALVAGMADVLICYHHAQEPIFLDLARYERIELGTEWLKPYAASHRGQPIFKLPGTSKSQVPLLTYSSGAVLSRMVDIILQSAPGRLYARKVCESEMANVVLEMAIAGHGVAWLPESTAAQAVAAGQLKLAGDARWALPLTVFVYRDRSNTSAAVERLMTSLKLRGKRGVGSVRAQAAG